MFNFTGYVQGMSDLLAPLLAVMENEVDTFWCFVGFMETVVRAHCVRKAHGGQQLYTKLLL